MYHACPYIYHVHTIRYITRKEYFIVNFLFQLEL